MSKLQYCGQMITSLCHATQFEGSRHLRGNWLLGLVMVNEKGDGADIEYEGEN